MEALPALGTPSQPIRHHELIHVIKSVFCDPNLTQDLPDNSALDNLLTLYDQFVQHFPESSSTPPLKRYYMLLTALTCITEFCLKVNRTFMSHVIDRFNILETSTFRATEEMFNGYDAFKEYHDFNKKIFILFGEKKSTEWFEEVPSTNDNNSKTAATLEMLQSIDPSTLPLEMLDMLQDMLLEASNRQTEEPPVREKIRHISSFALKTTLHPPISAVPDIRSNAALLYTVLCSEELQSDWPLLTPNPYDNNDEETLKKSNHMRPQSENLINDNQIGQQSGKATNKSTQSPSVPVQHSSLSKPPTTKRSTTQRDTITNNKYGKTLVRYQRTFFNTLSNHLREPLLYAIITNGATKQHPSFVHVDSLLTRGKNAMFSLPFYPHGDLLQFMTHHSRLVFQQSGDLLLQLSTSLDFLHNHLCIAHMDIKPHNILIDVVRKPPHQASGHPPIQVTSNTLSENDQIIPKWADFGLSQVGYFPIGPDLRPDSPNLQPEALQTFQNDLHQYQYRAMKTAYIVSNKLEYVMSLDKMTEEDLLSPAMPSCEEPFQNIFMDQAKLGAFEYVDQIYFLADNGVSWHWTYANYLREHANNGSMNGDDDDDDDDDNNNNNDIRNEEEPGHTDEHELKLNALWDDYMEQSRKKQIQENSLVQSSMDLPPPPPPPPPPPSRTQFTKVRLSLIQAMCPSKKPSEIRLRVVPVPLPHPLYYSAASNEVCQYAKPGESRHIGTKMWMAPEISRLPIHNDQIRLHNEEIKAYNERLAQNGADFEHFVAIANWPVFYDVFKSDVFSLGLTFFFLLHGTHLYDLYYHYLHAMLIFNQHSQSMKKEVAQHQQAFSHPHAGSFPGSDTGIYPNNTNATTSTEQHFLHPHQQSPDPLFAVEDDDREDATFPTNLSTTNSQPDSTESSLLPRSLPYQFAMLEASRYPPAIDDKITIFHDYLAKLHTAYAAQSCHNSSTGWHQQPLRRATAPLSVDQVSAHPPVTSSWIAKQATVRIHPRHIYELLDGMLDPDPSRRLSMREVTTFLTQQSVLIKTLEEFKHYLPPPLYLEYDIVFDNEVFGYIDKLLIYYQTRSDRQLNRLRSLISQLTREARHQMIFFQMNHNILNTPRCCHFVDRDAHYAKFSHCTLLQTLQCVTALYPHFIALKSLYWGTLPAAALQKSTIPLIRHDIAADQFRDFNNDFELLFTTIFTSNDGQVALLCPAKDYVERQQKINLDSACTRFEGVISRLSNTVLSFQILYCGMYSLSEPSELTPDKLASPEAQKWMSSLCVNHLTAGAVQDIFITYFFPLYHYLTVNLNDLILQLEVQQMLHLMIPRKAFPLHNNHPKLVLSMSTSLRCLNAITMQYTEQFISIFIKAGYSEKLDFLKRLTSGLKSYAHLTYFFLLSSLYEQPLTLKQGDMKTKFAISFMKHANSHTHTKSFTPRDPSPNDTTALIVPGPNGKSAPLIPPTHDAARNTFQQSSPTILDDTNELPHAQPYHPSLPLVSGRFSLKSLAVSSIVQIPELFRISAFTTMYTSILPLVLSVNATTKSCDSNIITSLRPKFFDFNLSSPNLQNQRFVKETVMKTDQTKVLFATYVSFCKNLLENFPVSSLISYLKFFTLALNRFLDSRPPPFEHHLAQTLIFDTMIACLHNWIDCFQFIHFSTGLDTSIYVTTFHFYAYLYSLLLSPSPIAHLIHSEVLCQITHPVTPLVSQKDATSQSHAVCHLIPFDFYSHLFSQHDDTKHTPQRTSLAVSRFIHQYIFTPTLSPIQSDASLLLQLYPTPIETNSSKPFSLDSLINKQFETWPALQHDAPIISHSNLYFLPLSEIIVALAAYTKMFFFDSKHLKDIIQFISPPSIPSTPSSDEISQLERPRKRQLLLTYHPTELLLLPHIFLNYNFSAALRFMIIAQFNRWTHSESTLSPQNAANSSISSARLSSNHSSFSTMQSFDAIKSLNLQHQESPFWKSATLNSLLTKYILMYIRAMHKVVCQPAAGFLTTSQLESTEHSNPDQLESLLTTLPPPITSTCNIQIMRIPEVVTNETNQFVQFHPGPQNLPHSNYLPTQYYSSTVYQDSLHRPDSHPYPKKFIKPMYALYYQLLSDVILAFAQISPYVSFFNPRQLDRDIKALDRVEYDDGVSTHDVSNSSSTHDQNNSSDQNHSKDNSPSIVCLTSSKVPPHASVLGIDDDILYHFDLSSSASYLTPDSILHHHYLNQRTIPSYSHQSTDPYFQNTANKTTYTYDPSHFMSSLAKSRPPQPIPMAQDLQCLMIQHCIELFIETLLCDEHFRIINGDDNDDEAPHPSATALHCTRGIQFVAPKQVNPSSALIPTRPHLTQTSHSHSTYTNTTPPSETTPSQPPVCSQHDALLSRLVSDLKTCSLSTSVALDQASPQNPPFEHLHDKLPLDTASMIKIAKSPDSLLFPTRSRPGNSHRCVMEQFESSSSTMAQFQQFLSVNSLFGFTDPHLITTTTTTTTTPTNNVVPANSLSNFPNLIRGGPIFMDNVAFPTSTPQITFDLDFMRNFIVKSLATEE